MSVLKKAALQALTVWLCLSALLVPHASARKNSSIVICAETGKVHSAVNADTLIPPASLTKMMTLYLTFKALRNKELSLNQKLLRFSLFIRTSIRQECRLLCS